MITDRDRHIAARVRLRRNELDMSQETLGNALGITFQQVQKYERAKNRIGSGRLFDIAEVMNVDVSYFYWGLKEDDQPLDLENLQPTDMAHLRDLHALPRKVRHHIQGLMRAYLNAD